MSTPVSAGPSGLAAGDLINTGVIDLVTANYQAASISILQGDGSGRFTHTNDVDAGGGAQSVVLGDWNGDGLLDAATSNFFDNSISVIISHFPLPTQTYDISLGAANLAPYAIAAADLDGDGHLDLVTANYFWNNASVLMGYGDGGFAAHVDYPLAGSPEAILVTDLNGDGKPDLIGVAAVDDEVVVSLGFGDGGFAGPRFYVVGGGPDGVAAGDLDGDGRPDLVVANAYDGGDGSLSVLVNLGDGGFASSQLLPTARNPVNVVIADLDGDGVPDLATECYIDSVVSVLLGLPDGGFAPHLDLPVDLGPDALLSADFNGDQRPDLATANFRANTVSVLLNSSHCP